MVSTCCYLNLMILMFPLFEQQLNGSINADTVSY